MKCILIHYIYIKIYISVFTHNKPVKGEIWINIFDDSYAKILYVNSMSNTITFVREGRNDKSELPLHLFINQYKKHERFY